MKKLQNTINHIAFALDQSGSMTHLKDQVIKVFDAQIQHLAKTSREMDQETRISLYLFNSKVECLIYDMDCLRVPSIQGYYTPGGQTALIDAALMAINDLEQIPQLHGTHSHLVILASDGMNNHSDKTAEDLSRKINGLADNFTVACLVPDQQSVFEAKRAGFPKQNIQVWDISSSKGLEEAGKVIKQATDAYMVGRSTGMKGTKNLFNLDASNLNTTTVKSNLDELKPDKDYVLLNVHKDAVIKDFVLSWKENWQPGANYYQLTKPELIQGYKQICLQNKRNGKVYTGTAARKLLNLPDFNVKVNPASYGDYDVFCQSSSNNRRLIGGTKLIILR